jgi:hypothetical protein
MAVGLAFHFPKNACSQEEPLKSYSKYDFIAGDKVIFFDDFSQDVVGDFPALWDTDVEGKVKTLSKFPGKWFSLGLGGSFLPSKGITFPANYTIEFDVIPFVDDPTKLLEVYISTYLLPKTKTI